MKVIDRNERVGKVEKAVLVLRDGDTLYAGGLELFLDEMKEVRNQRFLESIIGDR